MKKHIRNSFSFVFGIVTFSLLIFSASCSSEKPAVENICNLTRDKVPEVRGFRLGMPLSDVIKRFNLCRIDKDLNQVSGEVKLTKSDFKRTELSDCNSNWRKLGTWDGTLLGYFTANERPELADVNEITLYFADDLHLKSITIEYDETENEELARKFQIRTIEALGLNNWTNWKISSIEPSKYDSIDRAYTQAFLTCNKVYFRTATSVPWYGKYILQLEIGETESVGLSTIEEKQLKEKSEAEERELQRQKELEKKKEAETFKP